MASSPLSPLAPARFPDLPPLAGLRLAAGRCGIVRDRADLLLAAFDPPAAAAGLFARSATAGAPVRWCRRHLAGGRARALVVNAGNANVATGRAGEDAVAATAARAAALLGGEAGEVFVASTGVIGERLPVGRIVRALPRLAAGLAPGGWREAAAAIMTTDTFPKGAHASARIGGVPVALAGIAKGSGMVAPDMATMLAYVFTDARLAAPVLQALLARAARRSFHAITVDGDSSTSDSLQLFATGQADHPPVERAGDPALASFRRALDAVCLDLAQQVVRDGEGARKSIEIAVTGARSAAAARRIAFAVANSPLVKTAVAGGDANWGRIVMAVGKAGEEVAADRLWIAIGGHAVAVAGAAVPGYDEAPVARHMAGSAVAISVDVGVGRGRATVWTCDLTHGYIDINADYRS